MQRIRLCTLEIIHRLPTHPSPAEPFEPYAEEIVELLTTLVRTDNEDNATLCVKIISDIMRHQHKIMGGAKVQAFLSLIQELFEQVDKVVREQLDNVSPAAAPVPPSTPGGTQTTFLPHQQSPRAGSPVAAGAPDFSVDPGQQSNRTLLRGMQSFKVLAECPIIGQFCNQYVSLRVFTTIQASISRLNLVKASRA